MSIRLIIRCCIPLLIWIIGSYTADAQLVINEVCSSNDESYIDNNGDSPDWIELYNNTDTAIPLDGYYISDNLDYSYKWRMPNVIIGAGEFLIIIADGQDNADELRTSFKLAKLGEEVTLKSPDKELVDHMIIPQLKSDISYGRVNGNLEYLTPSPLAINNVEDIQIRLDIPTPTIAGGIYQNNIILDFTSLGEVHYKFNNRSKKDEYIYSGESITLTETTVICYWADADGYLDSPI
ncbi:MAG TPA: hypothetical protein DCW83_03770, partial [Saprospirales bacterium]|nr:hypothetical protein [Saprospirales bacterium]